MGVGVEIEETLSRLVVALCADFGRRCALIESGKVVRRVEMELRYLNAKIYDAASEVVGEEYAENIIYEIGNKIGYARSEISAWSESTYKIYKREVAINIARRLYLISV